VTSRYGVFTPQAGLLKWGGFLGEEALCPEGLLFGAGLGRRKAQRRGLPQHIFQTAAAGGWRAGCLQVGAVRAALAIMGFVGRRLIFLMSALELSINAIVGRGL
jgi:hypothetical protein